MISRRVLRIKTMQCLYAYFKHSGQTELNKFEKDLYFSIHKSYDLYHSIFILLIDIQLFAEKKIELAKSKRLPTQDDLNPNTRFIDNKLISQLRINSELLRYAEINKINWATNPELIKQLHGKLIESDFYSAYMLSESNSYADDKKLVVDFLVEILAQNDLFFEILEEQSIFWNDEIEFIIDAVIKTTNRFKENSSEGIKLSPLFKNKDDEDFPKQLLRKVALNHQDYQKTIEKFCINWEFDRIAFMDILIMEMAVAEVLEFSSIPTKVTFNEYIELSKYYSTAKSNVFVNGILDKIIKHLKETNQIKKQGRGLIGEK